MRLRSGIIFAIAHDDAVEVPGRSFQLYMDTPNGKFARRAFAAELRNDMLQVLQKQIELLLLIVAGFLRLRGEGVVCLFLCLFGCFVCL